ncbi:MAG: asparagine--tRNA ligase [Lentisphaerae bacterium RIFOXYB12_FULL_65_16]|nr:MAG: asparagine--tRNA ligase [Lentisphaerae bacterium RIFOXYA12_64_32]OGV88120.1 MAG: asparagine--tRNA ligase [Lentisphaerae bacterium RIFOXYB12_FULL_65_16]
MKRTLIHQVLQSPALGSDITVAGWVRTRRDSKGGFSFIELNDGSCFGNLQVIADAKLSNYETEVVKLFPGSSVVVQGKLVASQGAEQAFELAAANVKVLGFCEPTEYPLGKQRISFERLREVAHLRARTNSFGAVARVRNALAFATHKFFQDRHFLYLHTPIITASDCEGAGEMFQVTTLPLDKLPRDPETQQIDYKLDFFGKRASLTVSGQLEGETYACALGDIYTFGPTFRAENSNTRRHLAEFWMIEPEMAFADLADDADLAEDYLRFLFRYVLEHCQEDLKFFNDRIDKTVTQTLTSLADSQFRRITYTEAVDILKASGKTFEFPVEWGSDLQSEHERYLTEEHFKGPVTVTGYPKQIKAFYMRQNDDGNTVAAMDVLLPNVGEIIGGSQREERLDRLEARIREIGFDPKDYWWYCDLRRFGSVPHAGFGLGFERMVQFCTGMHNIRDVIPYPRAPGSVEF